MFRVLPGCATTLTNLIYVSLYINWILHFFAEKITVCLAKVSKHELAFLARIFCDLPWEFDQKSYSEDFPGNGGLDTSGYIYVPTKCQWANCNLLLFLHGCIGAKEYVGDKVIVQAGFLEGIRTMLHINRFKVFVKITFIFISPNRYIILSIFFIF